VQQFLVQPLLLKMMKKVIQKTDVKESQWSGDIELGYIYKSGNTNEETALLRQSIIYSNGNWLNTLRLKGNYGKESGTETSKAYYVTEQLDYRVGDTKNYSFLRGGYDRDFYNALNIKALVSSDMVTML
jgi:putative salt-induced outer membrane protein